MNFAILMFIFSACLLLYAAILAATKDPLLIPKHHAARMKDRKAYTVKVAKAVAIVSAAPAVSATVGLFNELAGFIILVVGLIIGLWLSTKVVQEKRPTKSEGTPP